MKSTVGARFDHFGRYAYFTEYTTFWRCIWGWLPLTNHKPAFLTQPLGSDQSQASMRISWSASMLLESSLHEMSSSSKAAQKQLKKYFFKILMKRVDHFLKGPIVECSLHEMWSSSKAAQKVFLKNLSEESKPLFLGAADEIH